ncbi:unnamed protein product, partial [Prorocentrum cordatum]
MAKKKPSKYVGSCGIYVLAGRGGERRLLVHRRSRQVSEPNTICAPGGIVERWLCGEDLSDFHSGALKTLSGAGTRGNRREARRGAGGRAQAAARGRGCRVLGPRNAPQFLRGARGVPRPRRSGARESARAGPRRHGRDPAGRGLPGKTCMRR